MATIEELREFCNQVREQRRNDIEAILNDYLETYFIAKPRPWRAVIGNKKCRPIPIHRKFYAAEKTRKPYVKKEPTTCDFFSWPDLPEAEIREVIESLGFVITKSCISISVPAHEKGKPLTFAQKWVKKINDNYAVYVVTERKKARAYFDALICALCTTSVEKIKICDDYTLFEDFEFDFEFKTPVSTVCYNYIKKLLVDNGIKNYLEEGKYKGIRVMK